MWHTCADRYQVESTGDAGEGGEAMMVLRVRDLVRRYAGVGEGLVVVLSVVFGTASNQNNIYVA